MKILNVVGARPNFMKIAPIVRVSKQVGNGMISLLVHTGQHYDHEMSRVFFEDLGLNPPDVHLGVGSGSHAWQTARIMLAFEPLLLEHRPDLVLVVGDVNSTLACSLVAAKVGIPVAHVEAGLRSRDRSMPEEINRELTDRLCDYLFTTCEDANQNLLQEGIPPERIHFVGNVMVDTLVAQLERARNTGIRERLSLGGSPYAVLTLHRPSNVDDPDRLASLVETFQLLSEQVELVFPIHPRTRGRVRDQGLWGLLEALPQIHLLNPLGYLEFLGMVADATLVLTDSGGLQEETTALGVPCLTLRDNTERPVTVTEGTNEVVGCDRERILGLTKEVLQGHGKRGRVPALWDGHAAERIVGVLLKHGNRASTETTGAGRRAV